MIWRKGTTFGILKLRHVLTYQQNTIQEQACLRSTVKLNEYVPVLILINY